MSFTAGEKHAAVKRELEFRRRVYPTMIEQNRMTRKTADLQIAIFEEILEDYKKMLGEERLL